MDGEIEYNFARDMIGEKKLENGFLSKAGWTIYDDTNNLSRNP